MPTPRWASTNQAAEYLGVNPRTILRAIKAGTITGHRFGTKLLRVDLNEIDQALQPVATPDEGVSR